MKVGRRRRKLECVSRSARLHGVDGSSYEPNAIRPSADVPVEPLMVLNVYMLVWRCDGRGREPSDDGGKAWTQAYNK